MPLPISPSLSLPDAALSESFSRATGPGGQNVNKVATAVELRLALGRSGLPDAVKAARVEELMLTQQEVAFAKAKGMVGKTIEVLVDRPAGRDEEDGFVARSAAQAPDIDSVVFVHGKDLHAGKMVDVRVTDFQAYDLVAEVSRKRSRGLAVIKG